MALDRRRTDIDRCVDDALAGRRTPSPARVSDYNLAENTFGGAGRWEPSNWRLREFARCWVGGKTNWGLRKMSDANPQLGILVETLTKIVDLTASQPNSPGALADLLTRVGDLAASALVAASTYGQLPPFSNADEAVPPASEQHRL